MDATNNDVMDLSLDEIIKRNKMQEHPVGEWAHRGGSRGGDRGRGRGGYARGRGRNTNWYESYQEHQYQPHHVVDARYNIMNNRAKPADARDRLCEMARGQDARQRLQRARRGYHPYHNRYRANNLKNIPFTRTSSQDFSNHAQNRYIPQDRFMPNHSQNRLLEDWDDDNQEYIPQCRYGNPQHLHTYQPMAIMNKTRHDGGDDEDEEDDEDGSNEYVDDEEANGDDVVGRNSAPSKMHSIPSAPPSNYLPPSNPLRPIDAPSANAQMADNQEPDPFNHYSLVERPPVSATPYLPLRQTEPVRPLRGILRTPQGIATRDSGGSATATASTGDISDNSISDLQLSKSMLNRLLHAPAPNESMGIFAKMPPDNFKPTYTSARSPSPPPITYRIVVSNLHNKVTQQDIQELFVQVGKLVEARLVRPGVAEVIYETQEHAELAVDIYHNRIFDGLPMKCLLVHPRQPFKPAASKF